MLCRLPATGTAGDSGLMSGFSQRNDRVLVAPGEAMTSTIPAHLFGGSGPSSYFMVASGTSMAAPYVAGASALMREAMEFYGLQNITQDTINQHFRDTADTIYDSVTNANYLKLNLQNALDSLLVDEFGSTVGTAHGLGTLGGGESFSGMIGRLDDVDFFQFTAEKTGTITFSANTTHDMVADWQGINGATIVDGNVTFDVVAGESYALSLGSSGGLGHFDVNVTLEEVQTGPVDWGVVASTQLTGESVTGEAWYQFTADRNGVMTVESLFAHAGGNVNLEIYNANNQLIGSSNSSTDNERIDLNVQKGDTLFVRISGTNNDVGFRLTNLVEQIGDTIHVHGTEGSDRFSFTAGSVQSFSINGVDYNYSSAVVKNVEFHGGGGMDSVRMVAAPYRGLLSDAVTSSPTQAESAENVAIGNSVGSEQPNAGTGELVGRGFSDPNTDFQRIYAYSRNGEIGRERLTDDDSFRNEKRQDFRAIEQVYSGTQAVPSSILDADFPDDEMVDLGTDLDDEEYGFEHAAAGSKLDEAAQDDTFALDSLFSQLGSRSSS